MLHPERDDEVRDLALVVPRAEVLVRRVRASSFSYGPVLRRLSALASLAAATAAEEAMVALPVSGSAVACGRARGGAGEVQRDEDG